MKVVAFSYEIGSFGKSVAMDLAQNAGLTFIPFSDIYALALARNERFRRRKTDEAEKRGDKDIWEGRFFSDPCFISLFESIVLEMAGRGNVLMIGAGTQAVLRGFEGIFQVHVRAPLDVRVKRFMDLNNITVAEANQTVKWWDQRRRALFELNSYFAGLDREATDCDLVINTDRVTIPAASRLLQTMIREVPGPADPAAWQANLARLALAKRVECAVRESGSAMGLAPLEVWPAEEGIGVLVVSGFVHTAEDEEEALRLARDAADGSPVQSQLKLLRLHNDLLPPGCWRAEE
ncbi:cytidylate kinase-like family protein [Deltaproteobacteria bacterium OttesenSCG-928-M10]|nr:cytidylate kinase-like family protein [Deltaproteobacteria bacterium OttesenSCG-928-M10]